MLLTSPEMAKQVAQTEGVGLYYSENIYGVPPVLIQHVQKFPVLHEVNILITNRAVPVPDVLHQERILVETLGLPGFYHCICRYKKHHVPIHISPPCAYTHALGQTKANIKRLHHCTPSARHQSGQLEWKICTPAIPVGCCCITTAGTTEELHLFIVCTWALHPNALFNRVTSQGHAACMQCRYGYTEAPDQSNAFVESVLLTVLSKLYKELHSVIQNSPELSTRFPALASAGPSLIAAASPFTPVSTAGHVPGVTIMGPVPDPTVSLVSQDLAQASASPIKPLINKALQMTGKIDHNRLCNTVPCNIHTILTCSIPQFRHLQAQHLAYHDD